jgi:hypothetical protein
MNALVNIWHPKYGVILDEFENLKAGKDESERNKEGLGARWTLFLRIIVY